MIITRRDLFGRSVALLPAVGIVSAGGLIGATADASPGARLDAVTAELQALVEPRLGDGHRWTAFISARRGGPVFVNVDGFRLEIEALPSGREIEIDRGFKVHYPPFTSL